MAHPKIPEYGNYDLIGRIRLDAAIALANSDPMLLARGLNRGASVVHKFGAAAGVGTALKPVTTSQTYQMPQTAAALEIVSDDTNDNGTTSPLGSGALVVRVFGIAVWADGETTEDVTLNGTTAVALSTSFLRVHRMKVITSGTYATADAPSHDSEITLQGASGGVIWGQITSLSGFGLGQSEIAAYSVPAGRTCFMQSALVTIEATRAAHLIFTVREDADQADSAMQAKIVLHDVAETIQIQPNTPYGPYTGPCDLGWMGASTLNTADIAVDFELILFDA